MLTDDISRYPDEPRCPKKRRNTQERRTSSINWKMSSRTKSTTQDPFRSIFVPLASQGRARHKLGDDWGPPFDREQHTLKPRLGLSHLAYQVFTLRRSQTSPERGVQISLYVATTLKRVSSSPFWGLSNGGWIANTEGQCKTSHEEEEEEEPNQAVCWVSDVTVIRRRV